MYLQGRFTPISIINTRGISNIYAQQMDCLSEDIVKEIRLLLCDGVRRDGREGGGTNKSRRIARITPISMKQTPKTSDTHIMLFQWVLPHVRQHCFAGAVSYW